VVRAAFPKGTLAIRVREVLGPVFDDAAFSEGFPSRGRPAISPGALALVSVLQYAEGLSDRQAADQVRARMDWKFLLGLELDDPGFNFTVLGDFRSRLIQHRVEEQILEVMLARLSDAGLLRAGGRQRTDSTHVLAAVRTLNRMEFVGETLRAALEALAAATPDWLTELIDSSWLERYGARIDSYRFPKGTTSAGNGPSRSAGTASRSWMPSTRPVPRSGCARSRQCRFCAAPGTSSTNGTGRRCAGGRARTSRRAEYGWPPPTTSTPVTASSADPAGPVTRST
jgi:transposase